MLSSILLLFLVPVAGLWFFSIVLGSFRNKTNTKDVQKVKPPGPRGLPVIGSLHMLGDLPHRDLQNMARKYGPIMHISLGMVPTIVISSAEWAEIFLKINDLVFSSRNQQEAYKTISYGGKGLIFASYGSYWRNIRKLCTVHLLSNSKTEFFKPMRREEMAQFIDTLKVAAQAQSEVDLTSKVGLLIQDMTYRMIFGFKDDRSNIRSSIEEGVMLTGVFNIADYIPFLKPLDPQGVGRQMRKISKIIDEFLEKIIDEHMIDANILQGQHRDFIDVMLSLMDSNDTQEYHLVRDNIKAIILDMFAAAMDTTATVIVWTLSELLKNPRVMRLVQEELERVVGLDRVVEEVDLDKLDYLQMVIKESMRLHPVVSLIPRESIEDITINGYLLPKKSRVLINTWAIGRDPEVWSSNAHEFYPERFVGTSIDVLGRHFQFLPFGSGRRRCPGLHLASRVVELVVAQLVHSFDLELPRGVSHDELDMSETFGLKTLLSMENICCSWPILARVGHQSSNNQSQTLYHSTNNIQNINSNGDTRIEQPIQSIQPEEQIRVEISRPELLIGSRSNLSRTFAQLLGGDDGDAVAIACRQPRLVGGNIVVEIDEEDYKQGLLRHQFALIGRIIYQKGDKPHSISLLKSAIEKVWNVNFKLLAIGRGYFNVYFNSMEDQTMALTTKAINCKPGVFRVTPWVRDFNPAMQKQTNTQAWVNIHDLPAEYWGEVNLFNITVGIGLPLKIHEQTKKLEGGAKVLVDVDLAKPLPERILVKRSNVDFYIRITYKKLPDFCRRCTAIGHNWGNCRFANKQPQNGVNEGQNQRNLNKFQHTEKTGGANEVINGRKEAENVQEKATEVAVDTDVEGRRVEVEQGVSLEENDTRSKVGATKIVQEETAVQVFDEMPAQGACEGNMEKDYEAIIVDEVLDTVELGADSSPVNGLSRGESGTNELSVEDEHEPLELGGSILKPAAIPVCTSEGENIGTRANATRIIHKVYEEVEDEEDTINEEADREMDLVQSRIEARKGRSPTRSSSRKGRGQNPKYTQG